MAFVFQKLDKMESRSGYLLADRDDAEYVFFSPKLVSRLSREF